MSKPTNTPIPQPETFGEEILEQLSPFELMRFDKQTFLGQDERPYKQNVVFVREAKSNSPLEFCVKIRQHTFDILRLYRVRFNNPKINCVFSCRNVDGQLDISLVNTLPYPGT